MRWKYFIPTVILVALVLIFCVFFMDAMIRKIMISSAQMIFGAKVEISSVKTRFRDMSITVSELAVANRKEPMKNLFQSSSIHFSVSPLPLLTKKVIINEMSVDGIAWGTKRASSGVLPPRKERKYAKLIKRSTGKGIMGKLMGKVSAKGTEEFHQLPAVESYKNIQQLGSLATGKAVDASDLSSLKAIDTMHKEIGEKYARYAVQASSLTDTGKTIQQAQDTINALSKAKINSLEDLKALQPKLDAANAAKTKISENIKELQSLQAKAQTDIGDEKQLLQKIQESKDADYRALMDKLKLPSASFGAISQSLFGPMWVGRIETLLHYIELSRNTMPSRAKTEQRHVQTRLRGRDVSFPVEHQLPGLLIRVIRLTGTTGGPGKEGTPMDFKGEITTVTSDPVLAGIPTKAVIYGTQGLKILQANVVIDHTGETPSEQADITYAGITAKEMSLPQSEYLPDFGRGSGKVVTRFKMTGDTIDATVDLSVSGLGAPTAAAGNPATASLVTALWAGISTLNVQGRLTGTADNIKMAVSSDIDSALSGRLAKVFGGQVKDAQQKVRGQIDALTNAKQQAVLGDLASKKSALGSIFTDKQKKLQDKSGELSSLEGANKNALQNRADTETKKQEEELRKKAGEQLKGLFK